MRYSSLSLLAVAAFALTISEASAGIFGGGWGGWGGGGHGVPGPIAGAGLAYLAVAGGGYYLARLWRKRKSGK